ncbi:GNAT family protein [Lachnospiraceae bacterium 62-35]
MNIAGNKVILRAMEEQDRGMLLSLIQDPEIEKVTGGYTSSISYVNQMDWFCAIPDSAGNLRGIIADRESPEAGLGIVMLSHMNLENGTAEIYIKLMKSVRGKGYGGDAISALVSYAFHELRLNHIYSNILDYNTASRRLFEQCGFKQEGMHKSRVYKDGYYRNVCVYGIGNKISGKS